MTSTTDLIARTIREIESRPGYHYNRKIVEEIITRAEIPEGTVFLGGGSQPEITFFAAEIRAIKDGVVLKTMPVTDQAREAALVCYAKKASRLGHTVGGF